MSNTIFITANWTTGALSQQTISRQYDNNRYAVQFIGYPEGDGTEELDLYLLVWMSTAPGQKPGEITPIQLNSDQWYISNYFTQQVQVIKFQLCVLNEAGTYEAHSPIFSGRIGDSLEHNGTSHDIDVSTLFDAYREYIEELIIAADAAIIDPVPTQGSSNAVSSGGVYTEFLTLKEDFDTISETTRNLFDINVLSADNITIADGVASGTSNAFYIAFGRNDGYIPLDVTFEAETQYTLSLDAYTDQNQGSTSNGLVFRVHYTDDTTSNIPLSNTLSEYTHVTGTTTSGKTVSKIACIPSSYGGNIWHLKNIQLEENTSATDYIEPVSAVDAIARENIVHTKNDIKEMIDKTDLAKRNGGIAIPLVWECGTIVSGANANSPTNMRTGEIVHVKAGSTISKTSTEIAITAVWYSANDVGTYESFTQILPLSKTDAYTFTEDKYCRFVIQNPHALTRSVKWANTVVESNLIDADSVLKDIGVEIAIVGTASALGNCIINRLPDGTAFMIDCFSENGYTTVKNALASMGITHIDYFMISHYHQDHVWNVVNLINDGYIDANTVMYLPPDLNTSYTAPIFTDWLNEYGPKAMYEIVRPAITALGCTVIHPTEGQVVSYSGVDFKFFNCEHSMFYYPDGEYKSTNYNDLSLACYITVGNYNFCDTADIGPIAQQKMVDLNTMFKANLYTATHHGWDNGKESNYYGLLPAWINRLSPDVVFSEDYSGHDSHILTKKSPMQSWCEATGIPNYRTKVNGTMFVRLNKYGWKLEGNYSRYIRNDKNWSYSDNSEHIETDE